MYSPFLTVSNAVSNPVLSYNIYKNIKTVIIDEGVTEIGSQHFSYLNYLTTVIYPDSLTKIGGAAFQGCGSFTTAYKAYTFAGNGVVDLSYVNDLVVGDLFNGCRAVKYVRLSEAPSFGCPINAYDKASRGAQSYDALADEVISQNR